jgi:SAM-dependent methyltransferase
LSIHEVAATGFGAEAAAYERARPSYPADAVAWIDESLRVPQGGRLCDLAAGTGKFTRLLSEARPDAELVAVEPIAEMRALLSASLPHVATVAAAAECMPFGTASLDGVVVAQAFHWFDAEGALRELHRVLRPGARLALVWNARDRTVPWVDRVWSVMDRVEKRAPWREHDDWHESAFVDSPWFGPLHEATFHHEQVLTADDVVDRVRSVSHVAVLPPDRQAAVLDEVRAVLRDDPATAGQSEVAVPYRVDAYWSERI